MNPEFNWASHKLDEQQERHIEGSFTQSLKIINSQEFDLSKLKINLSFLENQADSLIVGVVEDQEKNKLFVCTCEYKNGNKTSCYPYGQDDTRHKWTEPIF